ncbi:nucleic acid-binding protein, partial [Aulographum hederae CBS 113979]
MSLSTQLIAAAAAPALSQGRVKTGVVISAGLMQKTVKVRVPKQVWNKSINKLLTSYENLLVSDPTSSLREGDFVSIKSGIRASKNVRHIVTSIVAPMGPGIHQRPHVLSEEELLAAKAAKRLLKDERR